ncbi:hypothetical protein H4S14_003016 [Agrobacterium vitis]|nr:hypothetical protein [Agrobacterium vitis]MBE1439254.1 hypothetical protein [Agrobacterium vitis]
MRLSLSAVFAVATLVVTPLASHAADQLNDIKALKAELVAGNTINTVVDLSQCSSAADPQKKGTMLGGLRISSFLIRPDESISFADDHFTIYKDGKPRYQFLRYQVKPDNSATFAMTVLSLPDYKQDGETLTYHCKVGEGLKFFKD